MMAAFAEHWGATLAGVIVAIVTAVAGGLSTEIGPWYHALKKPGWKPPDWAFGPVWTTIFILAVCSWVLVWRDAPTSGMHTVAAVLFIVNAVLNIVWSVLFFKPRRPDWAMAEVALLWLSIVALMVTFLPFSPTASLLLAPYLVWVSTASFLNYRIIQMNGPFGAQNRSA